MQLPLFQETHAPDTNALQRCLKAPTVAVDIETETRWYAHGPKVDYGLSYSAEVTVIALAWSEDREIMTTSVAAPFESSILAFLKALFEPPRLIVAHNAVFDLSQLSKLTNGVLPQPIWDTQTMARLLHPAVNVSYSLLSVASTLGIAVPNASSRSKGSALNCIPCPLNRPCDMLRTMPV